MTMLASSPMEAYGLPLTAFVQPIVSAKEAEGELFRAFFSNGLSRDVLELILDGLSHARSDAERVDIVNTQHYLSPASPDPEGWHREGCDCGRHGQIALGATVEVNEV